MTVAATLGDHLVREGLFVSGVLRPEPADRLRPGIRTIVLLSPDEPRHWPLFRAAPEASDGAPDPLDRWSRRVIGQIAHAVSAEAYFTFGGPPHRPFLAWALRSGRAWSSPVGLLVHDTAGLFISWRGALGLREELPLATPANSPCTGCPQPCLTACPAAALTASGYDVAACKSFLRKPAGAECMTAGCAVRRSCPVGAGRRLPEQSAFHMSAFCPA